VQRRKLMVAALATLVARPWPAHAADETARLFAEVERKVGGRIGVAALDTGSGRQLAYRADERFAMCSTFKWLLAAAILHRAETDATLLDRRLSYGAKDLLAYAPVTAAHLTEGTMSVRALCEAALEISDNTAANLLLNLLGGPAALTAYLRETGDEVTRLDRFEPELNTNLAGDPRDTTTPAAMLGTLRRLLTGAGLSAKSRSILIDWLKKCLTGSHRLRAGLPKNWPVGDKTGSGANGAANDVAIAFPKGRSPLLLASYLSDSKLPAASLDAAHVRIAGIVAAALA
jgi:beta-lactamase class A